MRDALVPVLLAALVVACLTTGAGSAVAQTAPALAAAGTDAAQVSAFLKSLQTAVALGNRTKVATLVHYPLTVWMDGAETTVRNDSEFQARYSRIFDADLKKAIAEAKVDTVLADQQGIKLDSGRVRFRPLPEHKNTLRIVAIGEPVQPR
jgi:hypothetical protein